MPYSIRLPDGTLVNNIPDEVTPEEAKRRIIAAGLVKEEAPAKPLPPSRDRTVGEQIVDPLAQIGTGVGSVLQFPGQLISLVPGLRGVGEAIAAPGAALSEGAEKLKSASLKAREAYRSNKLTEAEKEGFLSEFGTAIAETVKDPALLTGFFFEQAPQLIGPAAAAKLTKMAGQGAIKGLPKEAVEQANKELNRRAATAAVGTGAAMQGADVGADTYEAVYKLAISQGKSPEEAEQIANEKSRIAAAEAGVISLATSKLPGGAAIERRLAGLQGVPGASRLGVGAREALSESLEEAGGAISKGVALSEVDPSISPFTGAGAAAGFGALGGFGLGTAVGGAKVREPAAPVPTTEEDKIDVLRREAERVAQAKREARAVPPLPEGDNYAELIRYSETVKLLPKSKERDEALKEARARRDAIVQREVEANRISAERAKELLTAEEAAEAEVISRDDPILQRLFEAQSLREERDALLVNGKPPAKKSPARQKYDQLNSQIELFEKTGEFEAPSSTEEVAEPTVRRPDALPEVLDAKTINKIGFTRGTIFDSLVGKNIADPEIRTVLEAYKQRSGDKAPSPVTVAKVDAFLAKLPPVQVAPAAPVAPPVPAVEVAPPEPQVDTAPTTPVIEAEDVGQTIPATSGVSPVVAGEPGAGAPTGGAGVIEPSGVVPTVEDAGQPAVGEGQQPAAVSTVNTPKSDTLMGEIRVLEEQRMGLLTKNGRVPAAKSPARKKYDELVDQIAEKKQQWASMTLPSVQPTAPTAPAVEAPIDAEEQRRNEVILEIKSVAQANAQAAFGERSSYKDLDESIDSWRDNLRDTISETSKRLGIKNDAEYAVVEEAAFNAYNEEVNQLRAKELAPSAPAVEEFDYEKFNAESDKLLSKVSKLEKKRKALLTGTGWAPAAGSPARQEYDSLQKQIAEIERQWKALPRPPLSYDLTPAQRESLYGEIERISGMMPVEEYDAFIEKHGSSGFQIDRNPESIKAARDLIVKYSGDQSTKYRTLDAKVTKEAYPDVSVEEARNLENGLQGKSLVEAAEYLAKYFKVGDQRLIAHRVLQKLKQMERAGVKFDLRIVNVGTSAPSSVASGYARGLSKLTYVDGKPAITVYLRGADMDSSGMVPRIILHEFIHATTQIALNLGNRVGAANTQFAKLFNELNAVHAVFLKHFNSRAIQARQGTVQLNEIEQAIYKRNVNAGTDLDELVAWGLTSPLFQEYLETIPYQNKSLFSKFVEAIRTFLGLPVRANTVLSEVIRVSDELLNLDPNEEIALGSAIFSPAGANVPAVTSQAVSRAKSIVGKEEDLDKPGFFGSQLGENKVVGARVKFADTQAGLASYLSPLWGGKVVSKRGELNPEFQLARALDWGRFSLAMQREGTLVRDPSGLAVVKKLTVDKDTFSPEELARLDLIQGQDVSVVGAMQKIADSRAGKERVDQLLAGEREYQLYQNRAELEEAGKELKFFYTEEEASALHEEFMADEEVRTIAQMFDAVRFKMIDFLVDTDRWSAEKGADMKKALGYMPFQRISALDEGYEGRSARRGTAVFKNLRKYQGSEVKQVRSPTEAFSNLMDWMTAEGMKNEATSRSLDALELIGIAKRVGGPEQVDDSEKYKVIPTFFGGNKQYYFVTDPAVVPAFNVAPVEYGSIMRGIQAGSRLLRAGVTSTPPFVLKQIADDVTRIFAFSKLDNPLMAAGNMLLNFPGNWIRELRGVKSPGTKRLEKLGVYGTYDFTDEGNVSHIMEEGGLSKPGMLSMVYRIMEAGAKASDISVREAIFNQAKKERKDEATAEYMAREIINFSRRGSAKTMDFFIRTVPFFNAYAQGFDKLVAAAGGKAVGMNAAVARATFWRRAMMLAALGTMYGLMMSDDEEYNNLSDNVRDRNIVLPFNKQFVEKYGVVPAIPLPADLAFLFKAIPERIIQYYRLYGTDEERSALELTRELMRSGFDVFASPNITPQVIRPIFENMVNYSFFLGRPLESQSQQRVSAYLREGTSTSDTMKATAEVLNDQGIEISPIKLENFVRGMFGSIAGIILSVGDTLINPSRTDRPLHQMLGSQVTGASAFMKDALASKAMDRLYNLEKEAVQAKNGLNKLITENKTDQAADHYEKYYGYLMVHDDVQSLMQDIAELSKVARDTDKLQGMPPEERRQAINMIRTTQNEYARRVAIISNNARKLQLEMDRQ